MPADGSFEAEERTNLALAKLLRNRAILIGGIWDSSIASMTGMDPELAKVAGQVAVDTAKDVRDGLAAIFGEAAAELAHMFADRVKLWRFKQLVAIMNEARQITDRRGLTQEQLQALPVGLALRVADAASNEDEPEVQALWARLIANAISGVGEGIERAYIDLLKSLSVNEVILLDLLWRFRSLSHNWSYTPEGASARDAICKVSSALRWADLSANARQMTIQNLLRLRCIAMPAPQISPFLLKSELITSEYQVRNFESLDGRQVEAALRAITRYLTAATGGERELSSVSGAREWELFELSTLGHALMRACADDPAPNDTGS